MGSIKNKMHQIRFRRGLQPRPRWGAHDPLPDPLVEWRPEWTSTVRRLRRLILGAKGASTLAPYLLQTSTLTTGCSYPVIKQSTCWLSRLNMSLHCDVQVSIDGHYTDTAVGLETSVFYRRFYRTTCTFYQSEFSWFSCFLHSCTTTAIS